jgi:hypothetical protein
VAAARPGASSRQRSGEQQGGSWRGKAKPGRSGGGGQQVTHTLTHVDQARLETGLCCFHFNYGAKANQCLPATGLETKRPGVAQRHRRRAADPHAGPDLEQAFPRGRMWPPSRIFPALPSSRSCRLSWAVSVQHRLHAAAADRRPARRQEGGGQAGVVGGHGCRHCRSKAGPPLSNTPSSSHSGGGAVSRGGRLGDARGGLLLAVVALPEGLAAPGVLL